MRELTIYRLYFTNSDCFKKGVRQRPMGVQVHSSGANNPWLRRYVGPDDGRLGPNPHGNTHNRPGGNVCANAYIGKLVKPSGIKVTRIASAGCRAADPMATPIRWGT